MQLALLNGELMVEQTSKPSRHHRVPGRNPTSMQTKVSSKKLLQLNKPDWPLVVIGVVVSGFTGSLFPILAIPLI